MEGWPLYSEYFFRASSALMLKSIYIGATRGFMSRIMVAEILVWLADAFPPLGKYNWRTSWLSVHQREMIEGMFQNNPKMVQPQLLLKDHLQSIHTGTLNFWWSRWPNWGDSLRWESTIFFKAVMYSSSAANSMDIDFWWVGGSQISDFGKMWTPRIWSLLLPFIKDRKWPVSTIRRVMWWFLDMFRHVFFF